MITKIRSFLVRCLHSIGFAPRPKYRRICTRFCSYPNADRIIRETANLPEPERWVVAPEEDQNQMIGWVVLERRERVSK